MALVGSVARPATAPATDPARQQVPADWTDTRHDTCPRWALCRLNAALLMSPARTTGAQIEGAHHLRCPSTMVDSAYDGSSAT